LSVIAIDEVREWASESGALARRYFNRVSVERKADRSPVTQADREIEQLLRERIAARYPDHGIVGEEQGVGAIDREYVWCLDPIDGTAAFISGLPTWCVSIGVLRYGEPYLGVIFLPLIDDCYWAEATGPAFRNDEPIHVSAAVHVDGNDWLGVSSYAHRQFRIDFPGKTRSLSSVAADCCYVARGSAVGALIGRANLWDLAAGFSILRAAGASVVGLSGAPVEVPPLLDGRKLSEPILIGPPQLISTLRGYVSRR
jgi:fructose-1,6-bisphosphatase/inositol monophosphatase family enzyme